MIKELINAIAEGNTLAIEDNFKAVMAQKISDRLDDMRVSVAQNMFGSVNESEDLVEASETKFVNVATSKAHIARAQKALDSNPDMFHGAKAGFKRLITIHKKHLANAESNNSVKESLDNYSLEDLEDFMMSEDFEQLDEVSQKTLTTYIHLDEKVWDADGRTTTELKKQVRDLGDEQLKDWSKNKKSVFDTKKVQDRIISHEIKKRGLNKEEFGLDEERGDMGVEYSPRGSCRGSSQHSMDLAKMSGYTHAVMYTGTKGGIDTYHTTKAGAEKRLTALRKKHGIPDYSERARVVEL